MPGQEGPHGPGFGFFVGPEPWGPWRTVCYDDDFVGRTEEGEGAYQYRFPSKWVSDDGRTLWMVYSRLTDEHYHFLLRKATITTD